MAFYITFFKLLIFLFKDYKIFRRKRELSRVTYSPLEQLGYNGYFATFTHNNRKQRDQSRGSEMAEKNRSSQSTIRLVRLEIHKSNTLERVSSLVRHHTHIQRASFDQIRVLFGKQIGKQ